MTSSESSRGPAPQMLVPLSPSEETALARLRRMKVPGAPTVAGALTRGSAHFLLELQHRASAFRESHAAWSRAVRAAIGLKLQEEVMLSGQLGPWTPLWDQVACDAPLPTLNQGGRFGLRIPRRPSWGRKSTEEETQDAVGQWCLKTGALLEQQADQQRSHPLAETWRTGRAAALLEAQRRQMTAWATEATPEELTPYLANPEQWSVLFETTGRIGDPLRFPTAWVLQAPVAFQRGWCARVLSLPNVRRDYLRMWRVAQSLIGRALAEAPPETWRASSSRDGLRRWAPEPERLLSQSPALLARLRKLLLITKRVGTPPTEEVRMRGGTAAGAWSMIIRGMDLSRAEGPLLELVVEVSLALQRVFPGEDIITLWSIVIRNNPHLRPDQLVRFLDGSPSTRLRTLIPTLPQFADSLEIQQRLATSGSAKIQRAVATHATDADALDQSLKRLAPTDPAAVLRTLRTRPEALASASPDVFRPLLKQDDREHRLAAVQLVGAQQAAREAVVAEAQQAIPMEAPDVVSMGKASSASVAGNPPTEKEPASHGLPLTERGSSPSAGAVPVNPSSMRRR